MMKKEKWYNHNWTIGIGCVAIGSPYVWDLVKGIPFNTTIEKILSLINFILTYPIPLWITLIGLLIFLLIRFVVSRLKVKPTVQPTITKESILAFTGTKFGLYTWKWKWRQNPHTNTLEPYDAVPLCKNHDCNYNPLVPSYVSLHNSAYSCKKCHTYYDTVTPALVLEFLEEKVRRYH